MFRLGLKRQAPDPSRQTARQSLRQRVRVLLNLPEDVAVSVSCGACADPGCGDVETAILIMAPGASCRVMRFAKPVECVADIDVRIAWADIVSRECRAISG